MSRAASPPASSGRSLPTLRGRVSRLALGVIAAWLVVLATGFDLVLVTRIDRQVDDALRVRAQAASATVITSDGQVTGVRESVSDSELDSSIWVYADDRLIERPAVSGPVRAVANSVALRSTGYVDGAGHRFYVLPIEQGGRRIGTLLASTNLTAYERTKNTVIIGSVVVTVLLLAGAYPALRLAARRALDPVDRMTRQAADWSVTAPGERFGPDQRFAELSSLAGTLDELLDRLAAVLRHERHLSAELSHELRTPLARVAAQVDLVRSDARPDQLDELQAITDHCAAMDGIIDSLLTAARSELVQTVGRCDVELVLAAFVDDQGTPTVTHTPTDVSVGVERDVVERILAPVVQNARRYAAARVAVAAGRTGTEVWIEVGNDGPRLDPALAERVFEPGFRADPFDGHDGAGLGLALARRIARASDGDLQVDVDARITTFRLTLPSG